MTIGDMYRETAVIIYNDEIYTEDNHQYALEQIIEKYQLDLEIDADRDLNHAVDVTVDLRDAKEIHTLDIFTEDFESFILVAHDYETLVEKADIIKAYAQANNYGLAFFTDFKGGDITFVTEEYLDTVIVLK